MFSSWFKQYTLSKLRIAVYFIHLSLFFFLAKNRFRLIKYIAKLHAYVQVCE